MTKRIVLCADDYGQAPAISRGIIALAQASRLTATSCMVTTPYWPLHGKWLLPLQFKIDIGLHFNLTEGRALSSTFIKMYGENFPTLPRLMHKAFLRHLNRLAIESELHAQLDSFMDVMGCLPKFIDGHQHIHQFPIIRTALVNVYQQRLNSHHVHIRLVNEKIHLGELKKLIIRVSGSKAFKRLLEKYAIPHNLSFAGIYAFSQAAHYHEFFPRFLETVGNQGLIMCHPGHASTETMDTIAEARYQEYQYLISEQFLKDCQAKNVALGRLGTFFV